ncbi:MAG: M28 family peptidase [Bacteroidales bacterium]|nr:M28 family peptidase [Bacteroidales bacterium]
MLRINNILILFLFSFTGNIISAQDNNLKERLQTHVKILASDSLQGRGLGTDGAEKARDYIVGQFRDAGIQPIGDDYLQNFSFRQSLAWIPASNIVGLVEGNDPVLKDEFILIGAHYDHLGYDIRNDEKRIFFGADDNASGVAAIIELGRYFAQNSDLMGRSLLIVAFDAEESGLIGSNHFVDNSPVPLENIKLMFSFDMVGMYETNRGLHLRGMASLDKGDELAAVVAQRHEMILRQTGENIEGRTDTQPFGSAGIPAVHVYTGQKSPYHKPEDQYHLLDYDGMETIHLFMKDFLKVLSHESELRQSASLIASVLQESTFAGRRPAAGFLLNTGTGFHRYPDEFFQAKTLLNVSAGFYFQVPLSQLFGLQLEALYDLNGSQIDGGNFRRHSLTVPLNIQFGTPGVQGQDIRLFVFSGPYYRHTFAGERAGTTLDFENDFNRDEWGYTIGVGLNIFRVYMGYTSRRAVTDLLKSDEIKILDSNGYFSIGYRF